MLIIRATVCFALFELFHTVCVFCELVDRVRGGRGKTPMRGKTPYSIIFYKDRKQAEDTDVFSFIL